MSKRLTREVDEGDAPYFGVDTKEIVLLRHLVDVLQDWRNEADGFSSEDVNAALDAVIAHYEKERHN